MDIVKESSHNCGPYEGKGKVWCDDRADIYVGSCSKITSERYGSQFFSNTTNINFNGSCCDYVYIICWSNDAGRNGLLVELQGDNRIISGDNDWEVFATGNNKNWSSGVGGDEVLVSEINLELRRACKENGWVRAVAGQSNDNNNYFPIVPAMPSDAKFIWHDSGKDSDNNSPFHGFNHDEFLIFRVPIRSLFQERCIRCECAECECDSCEDILTDVEDIIKERCDTLMNSLTHCESQGEHCGCIDDNGECTEIDVSSIKPCISIRWGDSDCDAMESDDFEVMCITVCNCYTNISFNNFNITMLEVVDKNGNPVPTLPDGTPSVQVIPIGPYCFGNIPPCGGEESNCVSREFVVKTCGAIDGDYEIRLSGICFDLATHINDSSCLKLSICKS